MHLADGTTISSGLVTQETIPLATKSVGRHQEHLLDAIASPLFPVVLGLPWLQTHNPCIDWATGRVEFQFLYCLRHCLPILATAGPVLTSPGPLPNSDTRQMIPPAYHDFLDVFSKKGAKVLPPHRTYDCPIELLPGAEVPFGHIYP